MAEPVNLNRFRKTKARAEKKARADANAVKFGRTQAQKQVEDAARAKAAAHMDGHKTDGKDRP